MSHSILWETVVKQCAPTLAGIKTGSLFPYRCSGVEELNRDIRDFNRQFSSRGLCLLPLRCFESYALLYLYRPSELVEDLKDDKAAELLAKAGYSCSGCGRCIVKLMQRLRENEDFPHEIGLFLSYPPDDVKGFIENRSCGCKCSGMWRVYGDEELAKSLFDKFKKCTEIYCRLWREGFSLEQLAVAV